MGVELQQEKTTMEFVYRRSYRGRVKSVILDWSGTTIDMGSRAPVMAFVELFKQHGVPITVAEARIPMGLPKKAHIRSITQIDVVAERWQHVHGRRPGEADVESMYQDFIPIQVKVLDDYADLIPGLLEAMGAFREREIMVGSTTGYSQEMMDVLVPRAREQGYVPDSVVCASDVAVGRPEPWMALKSAMEMRVYPMEAIVKVGDTVPDISEGLNAGMWTVALAKTGNELGLSQAEIEALPAGELASRLKAIYQRMYRAGAHYVVDGIGDVPAILDKVRARLARGEHPSS
jgi:phosphonoacetaldehyde hydrolase